MFVTRFYPKTTRIPVFFHLFVAEEWPEPHRPQILPGRAPFLCNLDRTTTTKINNKKQHADSSPQTSHTEPLVLREAFRVASNMAFLLHIFQIIHWNAKVTGLWGEGRWPCIFGERHRLARFFVFLVNCSWELNYLQGYLRFPWFFYGSYYWVILHTYPQVTTRRSSNDMTPR